MINHQRLKTNRIPAIDGLRTIAVLGVIWAHTWGFYNNIPWKLGIDLNRIISFGRNGVDLFFVISGFCMYLMYASKISKFTFGNYTYFLKKRWLRIAPAFYTLIFVEALIIFVTSDVIPTKNIIYHLLFINIFLPKDLFSPHYWSLATEFQFYLIFPLLFLFVNQPSGFLKRVVIFVIVCIGFRIWHFYRYRADIAMNQTVSSFEIWYRFAEFGFGVIAAILFVKKQRIPNWIAGVRGFLIGLGISYLGRILMLSEFANYFGWKAFYFKALGEPIMTFGFGILLLSLISSENVLNSFFSGKPFLFLGKISYSMYLWHYLLAEYVSRFFIGIVGVSMVSMYISLVVSLAILIPISWISFKLLEEPYFKRISNAKAVAYVEAF